LRAVEPDETIGHVMLLPTTTELADIDLRDGSTADSSASLRTSAAASVEARPATGLRPRGDVAAQGRAAHHGAERRHYARPQPRLYERQTFLEEIASRLSEAWPYSNGAIVIEGPRWAGKTALLGAACRAAGEDHVKVLRARGNDLECESSWGVAKQLFSAEVLGSYGSIFGPLGQETVSGQLAGRYGDLDAVVAEMPATSLVLIAIDDAHLADEESAGWLHHLARHLPPRVRLMLTTGCPQRGAPLTAIDRARSEPSTRVMSLPPLGRDGTAALLGCCLKELATDDIIEGVQAASGGSPFLVVAIGRALSSRSPGRRSAAETVDELAPAEVGRAMLARLAALPAETSSLVALLEAVAVLDEDAELATCALLAGLDFSKAASVVDCLVDDGLLGAGVPLRFEHRVVEAVLLQEMGSARRSRMHLDAAHLFDQRGEPIEVVAKHLLLADQYGDPWVARRLDEAGRDALARGDTASALTFLSQALSKDPQAAGPRLLLDLAHASAEVDLGAATRHLRRAVELGADSGAAGATALAVARAVPDGGKAPAVLMMLEDTAARLGATDRDLQIELEVATAELSGSASRAIQAHTTVASVLGPLHPAVTPAERSGLALVAVVVSMSPRRGSAVQVAQLVNRALWPSELVSGDRTSVRLRARAIYSLAVAGSFGQAESLASLALEQAKALRDPMPAAEFSVSRAKALLLQGRLGEAEAQAWLSLRAMHGQPWRTRPLAWACLAEALSSQGRTSEALELLAESFDDLDLRAPSFEARQLLEQRGRLLLLSEKVDDALCDFELAERWAEQDGVDNPGATSWRSGMAAGVVAQGRPEEGLRFANDNLELASAFGAPWLVGAALVEAAAASPAAARVAHLREAVGVLESAGAPLVLANALIELGSELRRDGTRGPEAIDALSRGADLAFRCGAAGLVGRAATALRAAGARPRRLALSGLESLTPAERRVAAMASAGNTNAEIAAKLFLAEKTVEGHLASVYRKLGVRSRRQLGGLLEQQAPA
jgi:DNA-binding CsgD family transcriptional regulator